jgi:hypothetical protein
VVKVTGLITMFKNNFLQVAVERLLIFIEKLPFMCV